jgi:hypothetical protein
VLHDSIFNLPGSPTQPIDTQHIHKKFQIQGGEKIMVTTHQC